MYKHFLALPLVILNGYNAWIQWIRCQAPTYMNTLQYPLNLVDLQGSQFTKLAQALAGTVNTVSLNLTAGQAGSRVFMFEYLIIFKLILPV